MAVKDFGVGPTVILKDGDSQVQTGTVYDPEKDVYYQVSTNNSGERTYRMISPNGDGTFSLTRDKSGNLAQPVKMSNNKGAFVLANPGGKGVNYELTPGQTALEYRNRTTTGEGPHGGADWLMPLGADVYNMGTSNGEVIKSTDSQVVVKYQDPNGRSYVIQYNHVDPNLKVGDKVTPNTKIGVIQEYKGGNHLDTKVAFMNEGVNYSDVNGDNYKSSNNFSGWEELTEDDFLTEENQAYLRNGDSVLIRDDNDVNNVKIIVGSNTTEGRNGKPGVYSPSLDPKYQDDPGRYYQVGPEVITGISDHYGVYVGGTQNKDGHIPNDGLYEYPEDYSVEHDPLFEMYERQFYNLLKKHGFDEYSRKDLDNSQGNINWTPELKESYQKLNADLVRLKEQLNPIMQDLKSDIESLPEDNIITSKDEGALRDAKMNQYSRLVGNVVDLQKKYYEDVQKWQIGSDIFNAETTIKNSNAVLNNSGSSERAKVKALEQKRAAEEEIQKNRIMEQFNSMMFEAYKDPSFVNTLAMSGDVGEALNHWWNESGRSVPEGFESWNEFGDYVAETGMLTPMHYVFTEMKGTPWNAKAIRSIQTGGTGGSGGGSTGSSQRRSESGNTSEPMGEVELSKLGKNKVNPSEEQTTWDNTDPEKVAQADQRDIDAELEMIDNAIALNENYVDPVTEDPGGVFDPGYIGDAAQAITGAAMMEDIPGYEPSRMFTDSMALSESMKDVGLTEAEKAYAMELAQEGYVGDVENIKRMSGGSAGTALANLGGAADRYASAGARVAAEDRLARRQNRDQYYRAAQQAESVNRQIYEDDLDQDMMNMEAAAQLMNDGLYNARERAQFNRAYGPNSAYGRNQRLQNDRQQLLLDADRNAAAAQRIKNLEFYRERKGELLSQKNQKPAVDPVALNDMDPVELVGQLIKDDQEIPLPPNVSNDLKWSINDF